MRREVVTIEEEKTVAQAAQIMQQNEISCLLVTSEKELTGIITEKDLSNQIVAKALDASKVKISEIMTKNVIVIKSDELIEKAVQLMRTHSIKKLPVLSIDGKLVGVISQTDVTMLYSTLYANAEIAKTVSQLGHDLRGPLGNIKNTAYLISRHPEKTSEYLDFINDAVDISTQLLDDIKK